MTRLKPQVVLLGFVSLLNDTASEMIYPLLPIFLTTTLGATPLIVGMIEGAADGLASILKFVAGSFSDRLGRRKPLIVSGYGLAAGSRVMIGLAAAWPWVLSARLVDRTGKGIRSAPRDAMIADVTEPENRGRAFGFHRALDHTGAVIGPLIAVVLLQFVTMRQLFLIAVIPGAIAVLLLVFALREGGAPPTSAATGSAGGTPVAPLPRPFRRLMVAIGFFALANSTDAFLILQAYAAGVSAAMLPLLWAAHHVVKSLFSTHAGALSDRVGRRGLLAIGWTLYGFIYLLFPMAASLTAFVALFIAYSIPFTLTEGAERAMISDLVPAGARGRSFGIYYLVNGAGVLIGSTLFGLLYQNVSPYAAFAAGAALAFAAAIGILRRD
jgi:MFS family permease